MNYVVDSSTVEGVKKIPRRTSKLLLSEIIKAAMPAASGQAEDVPPKLYL